jgi:hypothetical protein
VCVRTIRIPFDFRRDVDEVCRLLGYYAASSGNCLPTFRDNVSVASSQVKSPSGGGGEKIPFIRFRMAQIDVTETSACGPVGCPMYLIFGLLDDSVVSLRDEMISK